MELEPGDILFIPALWFHNMLAHDFGVAVNVFWKELDSKLYDNRDPYGNRYELDRGSIGSSPKYGIGPQPKKNKDFQNDPNIVKGWKGWDSSV